MNYDISNKYQYLSSEGYMVVNMPEHPKAIKCGKLKVHVAVAYNKYGNIPEGYVVHHLDMNKTNNDPSNLIILPSTQHTELHNYLRKHPEAIGLTEEETINLINSGVLDKIDDDVENPTSQLELDIKRLQKKLKSKFLTDNEKKDVSLELEDKKSNLRKLRSINNKKVYSNEDLINFLTSSRSVLEASQKAGLSYQTFRTKCSKVGIDYKQYLYEPMKDNKFIDKICPVCGKKFTCTERDERTYCSKACAENRYDNILTKKTILGYLKDGVSLNAISKKLGIERHTVKKYAQKHNLL